MEGILGFTNSSLGDPPVGLWERVDLDNFRPAVPCIPAT